MTRTTALLLALFLFNAVGFGQLRASFEEADPELKASRELAEEILRVPSNRRRSELLGELMARADAHRHSVPVLKKAVQDTWNLACKRLGSRSFERSFRRLVEQRGKLDGLRRSTLRLVRDEYLYPWPSHPPQADQDAAARFLRAQATIDKNVEAMREIWRESPAVRVPKAMLEAVDLAHWARLAKGRVARQLGVTIDLARPSIPPWMLGIPTSEDLETFDIKAVTLAHFGLSFHEGRTLALNRDVRRMNAEDRGRYVGLAAGSFETERIQSEFSQMRYTNDYRELMGLRVLRFSPALFDACRQHAGYMWELGEVTHAQPAAEFATVAIRAERVGYSTHVWENCHIGSNQAFDALETLMKSSGHHRTMVLPQLHEIATARVGLAWVQNYGLDTGFQSAIQWGVWRD